MTDTPRPLGPGDDDPRSPAAAVAEAPAPLGPGDADPRSPVRGTPVTIAPPLGPGESHPDDDVDDALEMLAPPPAGPGGVDTGPRHVTHVPKRKPTIATGVAPMVVETTMPPTSIKEEDDQAI